MGLMHAEQPASADRLNPLGLTSPAFLAAAAERGVREGRAMELYRAFFRDGRAGADWIAPPAPVIGGEQREDATTKFTLRIDEQLETESVILPYAGRTGRARNTLCLSSQIGCAMGCTFCETAQMGLMRNLSVEQIVGQWHAARFTFGTPINNIVFMGMGEPMDNLDAVLGAIRVLADHNGPGIASSKIAVSTVGRAEGIRQLRRLAEEPGFRRVQLAVSINAPNDEIRSRIMPINRATNMAELREAMLEWPARNTRRILIEYVVIPGVNDALEHADELAAYLQPLLCTVNVIPYNPRRNSPWPAPRDEAVRAFMDRLIGHGLFVTRRRTMGRSLMGACGQLGNEKIRRRRLVPIAIPASETAGDP